MYLTVSFIVFLLLMITAFVIPLSTQLTENFMLLLKDTILGEMMESLNDILFNDGFKSFHEALWFVIAYATYMVISLIIIVIISITWIVTIPLFSIAFILYITHKSQ